MPAPRRTLVAALLALSGAVILSGCGDGSSHAAGMGGFPPAEVTTETVQPASYPVTFEYVGQAAGSKDAEVRPRVTGIVERRLYQEGAAVKAGQPLFLIDPRPYEAQLASAEAELARAHAEQSRAQREAARLVPLAEKRAIGQKEADDAKSQAELAAAAVKAAEARLAEARLNVSYTRVVAPITGITSRAQQSEGSLASANQTLLTTISQLDPIWVVFSVSENERLKLDRARADGRLVVPANNGFEVELELADGSRFARAGRVDFSDVRVDPKTGTYEMRATVPNGDRALKPGQFLRVVLKGAERREAITVPQTAVMEGPQGKFVYVAGKNEKGADVAMPRPVVVGDWTGNGDNRWIVESGLKPGDAVIVNGLARIMMPGAPIRVANGAPQPAAPKADTPSSDTKAVKTAQSAPKR